MHHIEIHLLATDEDAKRSELAGLKTFNRRRTETCRSCSDEIAYVDTGDFVKCAIVLTDESEALLCTNCVTPVISSSRINF